LISRRYSLFFEFRLALVWRYPGLYIPPLPSKKVGGNKDDFTIVERKHFLGLFLTECTALKYIAQSVEIQTFLKSAGDVKKELEKLQTKSKTADRIAAYRACCGINEVS
jgi:sorting nexin-1/2